MVEKEVKYIVSYESKDPIFNGEIKTSTYMNPIEAFAYAELLKGGGYKQIGIQRKAITVDTVDLFSMDDHNRISYREHVIDLINGERDRQTNLWGSPEFPDIQQAILALGEEFGELCEAVNETIYPSYKEKKASVCGSDNITKEAIQVAAVCVKLIESMLMDNTFVPSVDTEPKEDK